MAIDQELEEEQPKPKRKKRFRWWHYWLGGLLLCVLGATSFYYYSTWSGRNALNHEIRLAREVGMATSVEGLSSNGKIPKEQNAAPLLKQIYDRYGLNGADWRPAHEISLATPLSLPSTEFLRKNEQVIRELMTALEKPHYDAGYDFHKGASLMFPEFAHLKTLAKILVGSARHQADQGSVREAERRLAGGLRLADFSGRTPTVISYLVRIAIESIVYVGLEAILRDHPGDKEVLSMVRRFADSQLAPYDLPHKVEGELVLMLESLRQTGSEYSATEFAGDSSSFEMRWAMMTISSPVYRDGFKARMVQLYRKEFERLKKDESDIYALVRPSKIVGDFIAKEGWVYRAAINFLAPSYFDQLTETSGKVEARRRLLSTAVEILRHRDSKGHPNLKVPALGDLSTDPFTRKPLKISQSSGKIHLYSVGPDRKDDGGNQSHDILFEIR